MTPTGTRPTISSVRARARWPASTVPSPPATPRRVGAEASAPRPTGRYAPTHARTRSPADPGNATNSPTAGTKRVTRCRLPNRTTPATTVAMSAVAGVQGATVSAGGAGPAAVGWPDPAVPAAGSVAL